MMVVNDDVVLITGIPISSVVLTETRSEGEGEGRSDGDVASRPPLGGRGGFGSRLQVCHSWRASGGLLYSSAFLSDPPLTGAHNAGPR